MSYIALQNTCTASTLAKQSVNSKPHYTPNKALKKAFKVLSRFFKSSSSKSGKTIKVAATVITTNEHQAAIEMNATSRNAAQESSLNDSIESTCSTLSAEEYENELNELAEFAAKAKLNAE